MHKLKIDEKARELRKQLEAVLPNDKQHLAVEITNISLEYLSVIRQLEKDK